MTVVLLALVLDILFIHFNTLSVRSIIKVLFMIKLKSRINSEN